MWTFFRVLQRVAVLCLHQQQRLTRNERSPHERSDMRVGSTRMSLCSCGLRLLGYFLGRHRKYGAANPVPIMGGMRYHRQMFSRNYQDGSMAITRFNALEWPAARDEISKMVGEVLSRMIRYIEPGH
jgi:hypothetical protein